MFERNFLGATLNGVLRRPGPGPGQPQYPCCRITTVWPVRAACAIWLFAPMSAAKFRVRQTTGDNMAQILHCIHKHKQTKTDPPTEAASPGRVS